MGSEVPVRIDLDGLRFLEQPGKVIPEIGPVTDALRDHVPHFVNGDEDYDILFDKRLVAALSLSETEMNGLALVHAIARVVRVGSGFVETVRIRLEVSGELLYLRLIRKSAFEMHLQLVHLYTKAGHHVRRLFLIGHITNTIGLPVN